MTGLSEELLRRKGPRPLAGEGWVRASLGLSTQPSFPRQIEACGAAEVPLDAADAPGGQHLGRFLVLDPFGDRLDAQIMRQLDQAADEDLVVAAPGQGCDEAAVYLDDIDLERAQIAERGEAGAEIVDREPGAEIVDRRDEIGRLVEAADRAGLGDLDDQPLAERLGLSRLFDLAVLDRVLETLVRHPDAHISLNVSPETAAGPDWLSRFADTLGERPDLGKRLIVEITETVAIRDIEDVRGFVTRLKNHGCRIAIDDFGAGYTSFRNLRRLGVDIVKIDGAFVQNVAGSSDDRAFVQTLIDLARRLELKTVAEWVQDAEAANLLRDWGCDYIQGRFIGLASDVRPWLEGEAAKAVAGSV